MTIVQSEDKKFIRNKIRTVLCFPMKGILFEVIAPVLMEPDQLVLALNRIKYLKGIIIYFFYT